MTVILDEGTIRLSGICGVEEAEALVTHLSSQPDLRVDLSDATAIHTALWQALMVFKPPIAARANTSEIIDKPFRALQAFHSEAGS